MIRTRIGIGIRTVIIFTVLSLVFVAYIVRADNVGSTFATGSGQGGLEMKIDSRTIYNGVLQPKLSWALKNLKPFCDYFFKFFDVKPGDTGQNTISIHIKKNPAWVCLDFLNLKDYENGNNEPESHEDANGTTSGELSSALEFFAWMDDGDNTYEVGERALFGTSTQKATTTLRGKSYPVADSTNGPAIAINQTKYVGIYWCAGDLSVSTTTASLSCNGEVMGNAYQTDSMKVDVSLRAVTSANNSGFLCSKPDKLTCEVEDRKGNNGHGNDDDKNDDSNPGKSNDTQDDTDDDGTPGNSSAKDDNKNNDDDTSTWSKKPDNGRNVREVAKAVVKSAGNRLRL